MTAISLYHARFYLPVFVYAYQGQALLLISDCFRYEAGITLIAPLTSIKCLLVDSTLLPGHLLNEQLIISSQTSLTLTLKQSIIFQKTELIKNSQVFA